MDGKKDCKWGEVLEIYIKKKMKKGGREKDI